MSPATTPATGTHSARTDSSCWTRESRFSNGTMEDRGRAYDPPYMDVQTVKNNLTVDQAATLDGQSHCLLLVEPVLIPDLGHTGVARETRPGDRPFFYPNGIKSCGLGSTIRKALFEGVNPVTHDKGASHRHVKSCHKTPSNWAGSSAYASLSDDSFSVLSSSIPPGQAGTTSKDVWDSPRNRVMGNQTGISVGSSSTSALSRDATKSKRGTLGGMEKMAEKRARCRALRGSKSEDVLRKRKSEAKEREELTMTADERRYFFLTQQQRTQSQAQHSLQDDLSAIERREWSEDETSPSWLTHSLDKRQSNSTKRRSSDSAKTTNDRGKSTLETGHKGNKLSSFDDNETERTAEADGVKSETPPSTTCEPPADDTRRFRKTTSSADSSRNGTSVGVCFVGGVVDAGGRDSEWTAERRAADREAAEVVGALRRNSSRLWQLVGGGV